VAPFRDTVFAADRHQACVFINDIAGDLNVAFNAKPVRVAVNLEGAVASVAELVQR